MKEQKYLDELKKDGIGIVKSSKKVTLVVGEMASLYEKEINKIKLYMMAVSQLVFMVIES